MRCGSGRNIEERPRPPNSRTGRADEAQDAQPSSGEQQWCSWIIWKNELWIRGSKIGRREVWRYPMIASVIEGLYTTIESLCNNKLLAAGWSEIREVSAVSNVTAEFQGLWNISEINEDKQLFILAINLHDNILYPAIYELSPQHFGIYETIPARDIERGQ